MARPAESNKALQSRNITLPHALDMFVTEQVASQAYGNYSEVIREAVRLLAREKDGKYQTGLKQAVTSLEATTSGRDESISLSEFRKQLKKS